MVSGPNVIPSLAIVVAFTTGGRDYALQAFTAQAIAGVLVVALAITGAITLIRKVWSPLVLGSMIMMIGLAVASVGIGQIADGGFGWPFWVGIGLALAAAVLAIRGPGVWGTLPVLLIIAGGYIIFAVAGALDTALITEPAVLTYPQPFPFGLELPPWDLILTMVIVALMATLNLYGNVHGYAQVVKQKVDKRREKRTFTVFGIVENILPGIFGTPAYVAYGENLGIVQQTRVAARVFILIGAVIFTALAFFGPVAGLMAAMPLPVSGAVLLGIAATVIGLGAQTWSQAPHFQRREVTIVSFSVFLSFGLSLLPDDLWEQTPRILSTIFSNPIITVILVVILLEQVFFQERGAAEQAGEEGESAESSEEEEEAA
jgi:xanthine permease XanP